MTADHPGAASTSTPPRDGAAHARGVGARTMVLGRFVPTGVATYGTRLDLMVNSNRPELALPD